MKEKKAGSAGQILGSIRGPEHCVLISNGFMGDTWGQRDLAQEGRMLPTHPPGPQPGARAYHEAVFAPIPTVEEAIAGLEEEEATLAVEVIGGDAKDSQALPLPKELLLPRVDPMVGSGLGAHRRQMPVSVARGPGNLGIPGKNPSDLVPRQRECSDEHSCTHEWVVRAGWQVLGTYRELPLLGPPLDFPVPLSPWNLPKAD